MVRRIVLALLLPVVLFAAWQWLTWPDVPGLAKKNPSSSAFIERHRRASDGATRHSWVPYSHISPNLKHAILVAEDIGFFAHNGFEIEELRTAMRQTLEEKRPLRGASTLTQQLAKNLWLSPSKNPWRKAKEVLLTRELERHLEKQRILELYLNVAQFGPDAFGAEAAARTFFGVSAARLSERQAAELAAGLSRPRTWNPASPSTAYRRRVEVIRGRMRRSGWILKEV